VELRVGVCQRDAAGTSQPPSVNAPVPSPNVVEFELTAAEHRALLRFEYVDPTQSEQLEAATPIGPRGECVRVRMEVYLAELLAGDLAYVINRAKLTRRIRLLNDAADAIELALR
jgi:hypothetical protein